MFQASTYPPTNGKGTQRRNRFLSGTEYVNILTWQAPTSGNTPVAFLFYRDAALTILAESAPNYPPLVFEDHARIPGQAEICGSKWSGVCG